MANKIQGMIEEVFKGVTRSTLCSYLVIYGCDCTVRFHNYCDVRCFKRYYDGQVCDTLPKWWNSKGISMLYCYVVCIPLYVTYSRKRGPSAKVHLWLWLLIGPKVNPSKISTRYIHADNPHCFISLLCMCDSNPPATRAAICQQRRLGEP